MALSLFVSIAFSVWVMVLYLSIGGALLRYAGVPTTSSLERYVAGAGLGFGAVGNAVTLLNIFQQASSRTIILLLCILTLLCVPRWICILQKIKAKRIKGLSTSVSGVFLIPAGIASLYFLRTLLPPRGFDAMMYHLSTARLYLENNGFYDIWFNPQSDYPMLCEMNYMIGLALENDRICRLMDFFTGLIACGVVALVSRECRIGRKGVAAACTLFLTMTVVIASLTGCDVDIAMAAWIGLAVLFVLKARDGGGSTGALAVASVFTGMALQTKIFGVFAVPLVLWGGGFKNVRHWKRNIPLLVVPFCMVLPWYIKSYLYNGTILSISRSVVEGQGLANPLGVVKSSGFWWHILNVPVRLIAAPWTFSLMPGQHQGDMLGPVFLAVLPFVFLFKLKEKPAMFLTLGGIYLLEVLFMEMVFIRGGASIRYLLVIPLLLLPVCIHIATRVREKYRFAGMVLYAIMITQVVFGTLLLVKRYNRDWYALAKGLNRDQYYESVLPQYPAIRYVNNLPEGAKVLAVYNYGNYLIDIPYVAAYRRYGSNQEVYRDFYRLGITHVLANDVFDTASNSSAYGDLAGKECVFTENGYYVFSIDSCVVKSALAR